MPKTCLEDNQMFASYLEWSTTPCRKSSLLSTCVFIAKEPSDRQANSIVVSVAHMLFSHTLCGCPETLTQSLLHNTHTAPAIQLERIHARVHRIQLWNLFKNPGAPNVFPTTLLHAKDSSWLLQDTGRHFFNLQVSFYGSSWLAEDDFLTHAHVVMIPFSHLLCLKSQSTERLHPWERIF